MIVPAAGPPSGEFPFIFTDEAGVPAHSPTEPFFGIGMLKISDVASWNDELNRLVDVFVAQSAQRGRRIRRSEYEFKFSAITTQTRPFYERLVDYFVSRADGYFCAFVVDKRVPGINPIAACGSTWDALITYSITLLRNNIRKQRIDERAVVIADNYQKPRAHSKYFERELVASLGVKVLNAAMPTPAQARCCNLSTSCSEL